EPSFLSGAGIPQGVQIRRAGINRMVGQNRRKPKPHSHACGPRLVAGAYSFCEMTSVAIIGAGPAGTAAAIHLGQLGVKDVVLVDRYDFPRDKTCGSGISPKGIETLKTLGVWEQVSAEAYGISGLRLVLPGGREVFASGGKEAAAIICCRRRFDHLLLERARALGVRFIPNF